MDSISFFNFAIKGSEARNVIVHAEDALFRIGEIQKIISQFAQPTITFSALRGIMFQDGQNPEKEFFIDPYHKDALPEIGQIFKDVMDLQTLVSPLSTPSPESLASSNDASPIISAPQKPPSHESDRLKESLMELNRSLEKLNSQIENADARLHALERGSRLEATDPFDDNASVSSEDSFVSAVEYFDDTESVESFGGIDDSNPLGLKWHGSANQYQFSVPSAQKEYRPFACSLISAQYLRQALSNEGFAPSRSSIDGVLRAGIKKYSRHKERLDSFQKEQTEQAGSDDPIEIPREMRYVSPLNAVQYFAEDRLICLPVDGQPQYQITLTAGEERRQYRALLQKFIDSNQAALDPGKDKIGGIITLGNATYAMVFVWKEGEIAYIDFFDSHGEEGDGDSPASIKSFVSGDAFLDFLVQKRPYQVIPHDARNQDLNHVGFCSVALVDSLEQRRSG